MGSLIQLIPLFGTLLDRIFPDPKEAADAKLKLFELQQAGALKELDAQVALATGQNEVNKIEAGSTRLFVAGWRPFVGWICGFALGFKYIGGPLLVMLLAAFGVSVELPALDWADLMPILLGMLGLGGMRTAEKVKGVA